MILADAYDAFLLDLDGVVWRGETAIIGADDAVAELRDRGRRVLFVTNNSSRTPRDYAVKLARMKIPTGTDDIVTSGHAVIGELRKLGLKPGDRVHVCGGEGLVRLLTHERFVPTTEEHPQCRALVVGWNPRGTFDDLRKASNLARAGVPFITSNRDATYPTEEGELPGTGAIVAAIEVAAGRTAVSVGKPEPHLFRLALERAGLDDGRRALFVGDRPETDVAGARRAGVDTALVLTGVTAETDLAALRHIPDELLDALPDVLRDLPRLAITRTDDSLVALDGSSAEMARVRCVRDGGRVSLRDLRLPASLRGDAAWRIVRRLLVEAISGAEVVDADASLRAPLERIGLNADAQPTLFD